MNGRFFLRIALAMMLIAALVGAGTYVYNAGIAQGMAASGKIMATEGGALPYYAPVYRPFGLGLFGLMVPLLFLFLIFGAVRGLFFAGWRSRGMHGDWQKHAPPMVEEWHRKMHETQAADNKP